MPLSPAQPIYDPTAGWPLLSSVTSTPLVSTGGTVSQIDPPAGSIGATTPAGGAGATISPPAPTGSTAPGGIPTERIAKIAAGIALGWWTGGLPGAIAGAATGEAFHQLSENPPTPDQLRKAAFALGGAGAGFLVAGAPGLFLGAAAGRVAEGVATNGFPDVAWPGLPDPSGLLTQLLAALGAVAAMVGLFALLYLLFAFIALGQGPLQAIRRVLRALSA